MVICSEWRVGIVWPLLVTEIGKDELSIRRSGRRTGDPSLQHTHTCDWSIAQLR